MASCRLIVVCPETQVGDTVAVVGAVSQLGRWNPQKAIQLSTSEASFPSWHVELPIEADVAGSEFKIIILKPFGAVVWESLPENQNRRWPDMFGASEVVSRFGKVGEVAKSLDVKKADDGTSSTTSSDTDDEAAPPALPHGISYFSHESLIKENPGVLNDFYTLDGKEVGQGAFGTVCKATHKTCNALRAVKTIVCEDMVKSIPALEKEIAINKRLDHPNIVHLYETFRDRNHVYLVMELCSGGELFDRIVSEGHFSEARAAALVEQMLHATSYMHQRGVCHRDFKPENFLFSQPGVQNEELKVVDFGLSTKFTPGQILKTQVGTCYYVAPEVISGAYRESCDLWSLGSIVYCLLAGHPPFQGRTNGEILARVKRGMYTLDGPEWSQISTKGKEFVQSLLDVNAQTRLKAADGLEHSWITERVPHQECVTLGADLIKNLRKFRTQNTFKKAALHVVASRLADGQTAEFRRVFQRLDQDGDGVLSVEEIRRALERSEEHIDLPPNLKDLLRFADTNGTGAIEYTEFIAVAAGKHSLLRDENALKAAFDVFDVDNDGFISVDELSSVIEDKDAVSEIFGIVDTNGDGSIDYTEFVAMLHSHHHGTRKHSLSN
eukprot:TRINITY_DN73036_c0_g1_i1.p1 TRINITY_DN73036_c0_g1~~TRINITY_DN73036_c0_g1_i1.p1  ORF type:complete len:610 (-),score=158.17 TRINITY_DN73036_c0_g1_i1:398-2227(-)